MKTSSTGAAAMVVAVPIMTALLGYLLAGVEGLCWSAGLAFLCVAVAARADARAGKPHHKPRTHRRSGIRRNTYLLFADAVSMVVDAVRVLSRGLAWVMFGVKPEESTGDISVLAIRNRRVFTTFSLLAVGMVGFAFAAVPLYAMFCSVTGYGGTPARSDGNFKGIIGRPITVRFDSNIDHTLPWQITPSAPVTRDIGTVETINYVATNTSDEAITGMAIFNVAPEKAGVYFNKVECFCFTEQTLEPGETVDMPIVFFVDPEFADNRELDTLKEITLSYTFYRK
jgi:cytochrome c oxidase assembly protein subunit 11